MLRGDAGRYHQRIYFEVVKHIYFVFRVAQDKEQIPNRTWLMSE